MLQEPSQYAGFWIRTGACIIDSFILLIIMLFLLFWFYQGDWDLILDTGCSEQLSVLWFDVTINYILPFILTLLVWHIWSASPGKILLGLKIVDATTGDKIKPLQSLIRYLGYFPSSLVFGLGLIWVAFDQKKQGWHDKMANTVVIKSNE
ncbi:RDD family protein [Acinetobacter cumulans]|jgi:uncharacterized RDD family membrane protein YckC|uniref:RDD family protein n=1 Tax=Acinetobacter cumulans TaxID=2136182 RepID=A0A498CZK6_9GAMM|nr:RDD family protein [Acinetobacter cumulans]RLL34596.1 RDD family protein [Acinetobacter cumulans]